MSLENASGATVIAAERAASPPAFNSERATKLWTDYSDALSASSATELKSVGKQQETGRIGVTCRLINLWGGAFAPMSSAGEAVDDAAWRVATAHDAEALRRVLRLFLSVLSGESALVGGQGKAVPVKYAENIQDYLCRLFGAARSGLFEGTKLYSACQRDGADYKCLASDGNYIGSPTAGNLVCMCLSGITKNAVAQGEFQERQRPIDPELLDAIHSYGMCLIDATRANDSGLGDDAAPGKPAVVECRQRLRSSFLTGERRSLLPAQKPKLRHRSGPYGQDQPGKCASAPEVAVLLDKRRQRGARRAAYDDTVPQGMEQLARHVRFGAGLPRGCAGRRKTHQSPAVGLPGATAAAAGSYRCCGSQHVTAFEGCFPGSCREPHPPSAAQLLAAILWGALCLPPRRDAVVVGADW